MPLVGEILIGKHMDAEIQNLETQAFLGDSRAKYKILEAKLRTGKLFLDNIIFRIAGDLGDPIVRQFVLDQGFKETWGTLARVDKFAKMFVNQLIGPVGGETRDQRIDRIHEVVWFLYPFFKNHLVDENISYRRITANPSEIINNFIEKKQIPTRNEIQIVLRRGDNEVYGVNAIFWALQSLDNFQPYASNLWAAYLTGMASILAFEKETFEEESGFDPITYSEIRARGCKVIENATKRHGIIFECVSREQLYQHYQDFLTKLLYTWDIDLLSNAFLSDYLKYAMRKNPSSFKEIKVRFFDPHSGSGGPTVLLPAPLKAAIDMLDGKVGYLDHAIEFLKKVIKDIPGFEFDPESDPLRNLAGYEDPEDVVGVDWRTKWISGKPKISYREGYIFCSLKNSVTSLIHHWKLISFKRLSGSPEGMR